VNFNVLFSPCIISGPYISNSELTDNLNIILQRVDKIPFYLSVMTVMTKNAKKICNLTVPNNKTHVCLFSYFTYKSRMRMSKRMNFYQIGYTEDNTAEALYNTVRYVNSSNPCSTRYPEDVSI